MEKKAIAPMKIVDLQGYNSSFKEAISWVVKTNIVKILISVSQIPIVVVPQIFSAVSERYFNYIEVLHLVRHQEILNLMMEAKMGQKNSPFANHLSKEEIDRSIQYLRRSFTFIGSVLKNIFIKKEEIADKYFEKMKDRAEDSKIELFLKGYKVIPFENTSFALGVKRDKKNKITNLEVFTLIKRKTLSKIPYSVVDFLHPKREYYTRNAIETFLFLSSFGYKSIPILSVVSFAVKMTYKEVVVREMQRYQMQEAAFLGYLDYNKDNFKRVLLKEGIKEDLVNKYIKSAYKIVKKRSLNPLFLTQEEAEKRKAKSELWLTRKDPTYRPFVSAT